MDALKNLRIRLTSFLTSHLKMHQTIVINLDYYGRLTNVLIQEFTSRSNLHHSPIVEIIATVSPPK